MVASKVFRCHSMEASFDGTSTSRILRSYDHHLWVYVRSESVDEVKFVQEMYPGKRDAEILASHGLLTEKSIMAHCVRFSNTSSKLLFVIFPPLGTLPYHQQNISLLTCVENRY